LTRVSIGTWAFRSFVPAPRPLDDVLTRIAELGYEGIEFGAFPPDPTPELSDAAARRALRAQIEDRGLVVSGVAAGYQGTSFLRDDDPGPYLSVLERNLDFAVDLGAERLIVHAVDPPELLTEVDEDRAVERLLGAWNRGIEAASARGVTLVWEFEPCWAFNQPRQIARIAHELAGPGFGVLYDTAHAHAVSEVGARHLDGGHTLARGQIEFLELLAGTIAHVHLLDSDGSLHGDGDPGSASTTVHVPFGQGQVDFDRVIPALVAAGGVTDWWTVDLCFWPDPWGAAASARRFTGDLVARFALNDAPA